MFHGPRTSLPPDSRPPFPESGTVMWSNISEEHTLLVPGRVLEASREAWRTDIYGQLALGIAPFQAGQLHDATLSVTQDSSGEVTKSNWHNRWLPFDFTTAPMPLETVAAYAGAKLVRAGILQTVELVATSTNRLGPRRGLGIRLGAITAENVQSSMFHRFGAHPLSGAVGRAINALAIGAGQQSGPDEQNLRPFEPDGSWITFRDFLKEAEAAGLSKARIARMTEKIHSFLSEQLWVGRPLPAGEVAIDGACFLKIGERGHADWGFQYLSRASAIAIAEDYPPQKTPSYRDLIHFLSAVAGREINPRAGSVRSFERRRILGERRY